MSGINCQAEGFKIPGKRKAGDVVKEMNDYNIRYGITKRNPFVLRELLEDFLSRSSYRIVIIYNKQGGPEKREWFVTRVSFGSFDFVAQAGIRDILMGNKIGESANKNNI